MICFVTGAAGFIASHLCRRLLKEGFSVIGTDSFTDFYAKWIKEKNIQPLINEKNFEFISGDLNDLDLKKLLKNTDYVFHHAAQAGVRKSWGENFSFYTRNNIEATQKLLEAAKECQLKKFIYASSSSVYGACTELPMSENSPLYPFSPYGVTKLAAEHLCLLYFKNYGVPSTSLRFFTVYGPGQRPDMAFHKFFKNIAEGKQISVYGDGKQTRDFTYIDDIINANFASINKGKAGEIYNIGGGNRKKIEDIFPILEKICQKKIKISKEKKQKGDVPHTYANIKKAQKDLDYTPQVQLQDGLNEEWKWIQKLYFS
ncbi:MAG: GDP-mannose 4,6-dehydratase [Candidatus Aminicenantes bacterium]|nr:GDP-mannose 4,6-dehydratase [Candidatus Aminicenantes bacterium]MBL7082914.1 GDP-mannose 4,6-dehydratase [Candidatus Aminicenantes bacterium]